MASPKNIFAAMDRFWFIAFAYVAVAGLMACCFLGVWPEVTRDSSMRLMWCKREVALLTLLGLGAPPLIALLTPRATHTFISRLLGRPAFPAIALRWLIAACIAGSLAMGYLVLNAFPNSGDEYAYLFQSALFREGRVWSHAPPLGDALVPFRTWVMDGRWASQYPPGWPALIALMTSVGIPESAVNGVLAAGVAVTTALLTRRLTRSTLAATVAVLVLILNPYFLFHGGSFHSHMFAALQITLLVWLLVRLREVFSIRAAVIAGCLFSLAVATRYFALVAMLPALTMWAFSVPRRTALRVASFAAAGAAPIVIGLLAYQQALTGDALRTTYAMISVPESSPGLSLAVLTKGLELTAYRVAEALMWISPVHVAAFLLVPILKQRKGELGFEDLLLPGFILAYVCFPDLGGNRYGPRYYFDAYPVGVAATIAGICRVSRVTARGAVADTAAHLLPHLAIAACLTGMVAAVTAIPSYRAQIQQREEPYRMVAQAGIRNALVIVDRSIKDGLIAEDYARNPPSLAASVLYARQGTQTERLAEVFPGRSIWVYERKARSAPGTLLPMSIGEHANPQ